ncbi:MAG: MBL fold metallo-hydrolase [Alistipes sp.]|nr:MBL fold metallo-hydrolase [Alistipes sp.]
MSTLTFLGTGTSQGVPVISCGCWVCRSTDERDQRLRTSALYRQGDTTILIDAGPDFRQQMLRAKVQRLDAILLTHEHKDHIAGIDDVRAFNYTSGRAVEIYAEERVQRRVRQDFDYAFSEHPYPGVPEIQLHPIEENTPLRIRDVEILPIRGLHYRLKVFGFRIGSMAYLTDMNHIEEAELQKMEGIDTLIINALRKEHHLSHFTLDEALAIRYRLQPRVCYLTHVSHQMGRHATEEKALPEGVHFAYDNLVIDLPDQPLKHPIV